MFLFALAAAMMCCLLAGVFFAFSSFVMPALGHLPTQGAIRSMQRINIDVFCWSFVLLFFGAPFLCLGLAIHAASHWTDPGAIYLLVGAGLLVGAMLVTGRGNVPLNDALARVDPDADDAAAQWRSFYRPWMRWNHLRTVASLAAACAFVAAPFVR